MQKLAETIKSEAYNKEPKEEMKLTELDGAAEIWASHCLKTYTGELLKRGLAISEAIVNFTNELAHPSE